MQALSTIEQNFMLMVLQVTKQLEETQRLLDKPDRRSVAAIAAGDDYIDTQKALIEKECFDLLRRTDDGNGRVLGDLRALLTISGNLERIADLAVSIARQIAHLGHKPMPRGYNHRVYFDELLEALSKVAAARQKPDSVVALRFCRAEARLNQHYRADLQRVLTRLRTKRGVKKHVTALFILHNLERMGDALLNIGEALLFTLLGERFKVRQYRTLEEAIAGAPLLAPSMADNQFASIWGTRSGVRVGTVRGNRTAEAGRRVLFKEGNPEKLSAERAGLLRWGHVAPGVAPQIVEHRQQGEDAALLLQYIEGTTFQELALGGDATVIAAAQRRLHDTLTHVWTATRRNCATNAHFLAQLAARLDDVRRVHADVQDGPLRIDTLRVPGLTELIQRAAAIEPQLAAPFSVFAHGDFNLDNILYNAAADSVHLIDVHRSDDMDYVQDVSVFLVSCFRLPVFGRRARTRLERMMSEFLAFGRAFAAAQHDADFEARLAMGLARSLLTSMRFELHPRFAAAMRARAVLLLSTLVDHPPRAWSRYRVDTGVFFL